MTSAILAIHNHIEQDCTVKLNPCKRPLLTRKVSTPSCKPASEYHGAQLDMSISADACKNKLKRATSRSAVASQKSTSKENAALSVASPAEAMTPAFWYSPTRFQRSLSFLATK